MYEMQLTDDLIALVIYLINARSYIGSSRHNFPKVLSSAFAPFEMIGDSERILEVVEVDRLLKEAHAAGIITLTNYPRLQIVLNPAHPTVIEVIQQMKKCRISGDDLEMKVRDRIGRRLPPSVSKPQYSKSVSNQAKKSYKHLIISALAEFPNGLAKDKDSDPIRYLAEKCQSDKFAIKKRLIPLETNGFILVERDSGHHIVSIRLNYESLYVCNVLGYNRSLAV